MGAHVVDVRAVLDGKVWPQDVHDFVGDHVDILDEQLALTDDAGRVAVARQLMELLSDPDLLIRTYAVLALGRACRIVGVDLMRTAVDEAYDALNVPGVPLWQVRGATLWDEAQTRLAV